ncbi:alpha/beta hydrolase [Comamonadaceae bacterium G21597-S1]|nr:alpha/beta hydrolase [Comamonadaceae bacterium G21597-S1]
MSDTYVLVHGAWHTGAELEPVADHMRKAGHVVHCVTLAGNRPGDDRSTSGLDDAITSVVDFLASNNLQNVRLVGHSYGGMVISGVADRAARRIRRLVYWNAFVPRRGECLNDMVPPNFKGLFDSLAKANNNAVVLPEMIWRDAFINDADAALSTRAYRMLNPQPYRTFTDKIALTADVADMPVGKSYVNFTEDAAMPHSLGWHPRLSERLGLFRLVQGPGSHEVCFTNPALLAQKLIEAGRD